MMQLYFDMDLLDSTTYYARQIVSISTNPNYLSNAYYCLMQNAEQDENAELVSTYASMREDMNRVLEHRKGPYTQAVIAIEDYLQNPHPWRWVWITISSIAVLCILSIICVLVYRQQVRAATKRIDVMSEHIQNQATHLSHELHNRQLQDGLFNILDKYYSNLFITRCFNRSFHVKYSKIP